MARPRRYNADYFSHDAGMRDDPKVKALRNKFGATGYAVWCMMLEVLTGSDYFRRDIDDIELEILSADFGIDVDLFSEILEYMVRMRLLQKDDEHTYFSQKLYDRLSDVLKKRETERDKANNHKKSTANRKVSASDTGVSASETIISASETTQSKVKESKEKKTYTIDSKPYELLSASEQKERDSFLNASNYLYNAIVEHGKVTKVMKPESAKWLREFRLLKEGSSDSWEDISNVLKGYCANMDDKYMPQAYGASSFREKYDRIKARLNNSNEKEVETEWKL